MSGSFSVFVFFEAEELTGANYNTLVSYSIHV